MRVLRQTEKFFETPKEAKNTTIKQVSGIRAMRIKREIRQKNGERKKMEIRITERINRRESEEDP